MTTPTPRPASRRRPKIVLARDTFDRMDALAEGAQRRSPELADRLMDELSRAKVVANDKLRNDVVAIGRHVTYRDESTGQTKTVQLVFPEDADISLGQVSVITPIGVALIGLSEGASFRWETRDRTTRTLTVLGVGANATLD